MGSTLVPYPPQSVPVRRGYKLGAVMVLGSPHELQSRNFPQKKNNLDRSTVGFQNLGRIFKVLPFSPKCNDFWFKGIHMGNAALSCALKARLHLWLHTHILTQHTHSRITLDIGHTWTGSHGWLRPMKEHPTTSRVVNTLGPLTSIALPPLDVDPPRRWRGEHARCPLNWGWRPFPPLVGKIEICGKISQL